MAAQEFSNWRRVLWPIHNHELKKIIPMLLMFFFISFNYSVIRNLKDALVLDADGSPGGEIIPFLKVWVVLPMAILFMIIFSKLSNRLSKEKLFYVCISFFIVFFISFALFIYPSENLIHPTTLKIKFLPEGFVAIFRIWSFSIFYALSELWASVALSLLFWGFANDITMINEAKRFYALLGLGANIALVLAGKTVMVISSIADNDIEAANYLISMFIINAFLIIAIYRWINVNVLTDKKLYDPSKVKKKTKKPKLSLQESFNYLKNNKSLLYIAILVISYGVAINLVEVTWKEQVRNIYTSRNEITYFLARNQMYIGWSTLFLMLFVTSNSLRYFGWMVTAQITPVILLITAVGFFGLVIFTDYFEGVFANSEHSIIMIAVIIGSIQNIATKSCKYSVFDPTKEMTYIPLDDEAKVKGKAAIDVVGARFGKAGGSVIQQLLFAFVGPLAIVTPHIGAIVLLICFIWIFAVGRLSTEFKRTTKLYEERVSN